MIFEVIVFGLFIVGYASGNPCAGQPENSFVSHPRGCAWYQLCQRGEVTAIDRCPSGLRFSQEKQGCAVASTVPCTIPDNVITTCPTGPGLQTIAHPQSCSKFIICFDGFENDRDCPPNQHFSPYDNECVTPFLADCEIEQRVCADSIDGPSFNLANTRDCTSFFTCIGGRNMAQTCPANHKFDAVTRLCVPSEETDCVPDKNPDQPTIPDKVETDCGGLSGVSVAHKESCKFWFFCAENKSYLMVCGNGLSFDADTRRCQIDATCFDETQTDPPTAEPVETSPEPTEPEPTEPEPTEPEPTPPEVPARSFRFLRA